MSRKKLTAEEVADWLSVNMKRVKSLRLLTGKDISRRSEIHPSTINSILSGNWTNQRTTRYLMYSLRRFVAICNALDISPSELFSRPDDMSLLHQDGRKLAPEMARRKKALKQTQEQAEMQALLESLGLDE